MKWKIIFPRKAAFERRIRPRFTGKRVGPLIVDNFGGTPDWFIGFSTISG